MSIVLILLSALTVFAWRYTLPGWKANTLLMVSILSLAGFGISIGVSQAYVAWSTGLLLLIGLIKGVFSSRIKTTTSTSQNQN